LGTTLIVPPHYEVATAVGAVVGNVMVAHEGEVFTRIEGPGFVGFYARAADLQEKFVKFDEAVAFVRETLVQRVTAEAQAAAAEKVWLTASKSSSRKA
jgi:hypothetical protein